MTTTADLGVLINRQAAPNNAMLSIYLNVDPPQTGSLNRHFEGELLARLRSIQEQLSNEAERRSFKASARRVRQFIARHKPSGQGLILFCSDHDSFF